MLILIYLFVFLHLSSANTFVKYHFFSPASLTNFYKSSNLQINIANYGYIPYGQSLIGTLELANPRNACTPLFYNSLNKSESNPIIVIERGGCHFVTKTHYAQIYGAKMVIIIDNQNENPNNVFMMDDGFGFDIHIPTIMITKVDGEIIVEHMKNEIVAMSFEFVQEKQENFVNLEFWMSSYDEKSYEFLLKFSDYYQKLGSSIVSFTPHYALWLCPSCRMGNFSFSTENCLSNGRYCIPDSESKNLKLVTGKEVVFEDLTQLCLFKLNPQKWWDYMKDFYEICIQHKSDFFGLKACSEHVYIINNFNRTNVEICINDSFIGKNESDKENIILSQEQNIFMLEGIQSWPSLRINNETFQESLFPIRNPLSKICEFFNVKIQLCEEQFAKKSKVNKEDSKGIGTTTFVIVSVGVILILALILLFFYQRKIRREMAYELHNEVDSQLKKYFTLEKMQKSANEL